MQIEKIMEGGKCRLSLFGRLDNTTAQILQDTLLLALNETQQVELDFANIEYVSSTGLRALLVGQKTAQTKGASMILTGVSKEVMEVFEMTGFNNILNIV